MEKKTIVKLAVAAVLVVLGVVAACGIGKGGLTYQKPAPYSAESSNEFSNVQVAMTIQGDRILDAAITSSGDSDLLTDELRAEWAESIVANQSYENDVISSASLKYSADSVRAAAADIFTQAGLPTPEPAATPEPEPTPEPEAPADAAATLADGSYTVEKATDFSTIKVEMTVEGGKVTSASVASAALEGQVDLLTDEHRLAWADQIIEKQGVDAVSGVTVSSDAVQEAVAELMAQAAGGGEAPADDGRIAELEAALADAQARAEAAEAKAAELETANQAAEAKVAELEAAAELTARAEGEKTEAEAGDTQAEPADISRFVRPRPVAGTETPADDEAKADTEAEATVDEAVAAAEADSADISGFVRPRPVTGTEAPAEEAEAVTGTEAPADEAEADAETESTMDETEAATEADSADISRFVRPRPIAESEAPEEVENAAEADSADFSRFVRPRPVAEAEAPAEEAEAAAEADSADFSRFVRPRPVAGTQTPAVEAEAAAEADSADFSRFVRPRPAAANAA